MKSIIKLIYKKLPFKKELFLFIRSIGRPPERVWKHLHFIGVFTVRVINGKKFKIKHYGFQLENEIFWKGLKNGWEKESINLWLALVQEAKVIFDIGANTGIYSLIAKSLNPDASVYAFEPVQRVYEKLVENNGLNGFDIVCESKAISDSDGIAKFYDTPTDHIYSVTINKNLNSPDVKVIETEIETIKLDSYLEKNNITAIDLLKIDVETHEPEVLEGFMNGLQKYQPTMLIEILNENVAHRVEAIVKGFGYLYFNIDENGGIRKTETIGTSDYYNYLLCKQEVAEKLGLIK